MPETRRPVPGKRWLLATVVLATVAPIVHKNLAVLLMGEGRRPEPERDLRAEQAIAAELVRATPPGAPVRRP